MIGTLHVWTCTGCGAEQATGCEPTVRRCLACRCVALQPFRDRVLRRAGCPVGIWAVQFDVRAIPGGRWPRHAGDPEKAAVDLTTWAGERWPTLLICGDVGVGKSMLAAELLWLASRRRTSVLWVTAAGYVRRRFAGGDVEIFDRVAALVVDDLGRDHPGAAAWDVVGSLIARRYDRRLQTIGTSNLSIRRLYDRHSALGDRLCGGLCVRLLGHSQR